MESKTLTIIDDSIPEPDETTIIPMLMRNTGTIRTANTVGPVTITIRANDGHPDQPRVRTLTVTGAATHAETDSDSTVQYTVAIGGGDTAFTSATTVTWTVTPGTAAAADFAAVTGSIEFPTATTFNVTIAGDDLNEAAETFSVQVSVADANADGGTAYGVPAQTTITDDDPITATLSGSASANEGASVSTGVTVTLSGGTSTQDVVITYNNADATGSLTIAAGGTTGMLTLTATDDMLSEDAETLSVLPGDFTATSAGVVTVAGSATLTINADSDDDITVTVAAPASANTGQAAEFTVTMSNPSATAVTVAYTVALTVDMVDLSDRVTATPASELSIAAGRTSGVISVAIPADVNVAAMGALSVTLTGVTVASGGGSADLGTPATATVDVTSDDPAARAARLEAPLTAAARGIGQLAANAVARRATVASGNFTIAGQGAAAAETLPAAFLANSRDTTTKKLLRQTGFSFTDSESGLNFWGGGDYISAEGNADSVTYDGHTTAFHLGMDTPWRDGLIGIAAANNDADLDFTQGGTTGKLETNVTSIHPYLTRQLNHARLWTTLGYGSGEAKVTEDNAVLSTDLTLLTAAFNIAHAHSDTLSAQVGALYSRATLDAVAGPPGLPKVAVHTLRITAAAEAGWSRGDWRPFVTANLRHDAGDGDTGSAGDLGGGVEWQTQTAALRLAATTHLAGAGAEEDRLTLTARKTAGRLRLGLNLTADHGIDTGNLLTGEWRF